jgi:endonuclease YncB( thermonuclease family)
VFGNKAPANIMDLEREEEKAKEHGVGIWNKSLKSLFGSSPKKVRQNERI